MARKTGTYRETVAAGEIVRAFLPYALPPQDPPLRIEGRLAGLHATALAALGKLEVAGTMVPSADWFLYGFTRKEAVISSRIEVTKATLQDVVTYEVTRTADHPADVEEVCNYVEALTHARSEVADPNGLPICMRLLCEAHARLMAGARGGNRQPGQIRSSQNWIGGGRPGNAVFVPPPADAVPNALTKLEEWIHEDDPLPPLVRAGLAHVQFETIHPFLDGNGRIGRLLISLLVEHWNLLSSPLLYVSVAFRRRQQEYYQRLGAVRTEGDWEGWIRFFLECVEEAASDGVSTARRLFELLSRDRREVLDHPASTMTTVKLFDRLPDHPVVTVARAMELTDTSKPTATKAIEGLCEADVLEEATGRQRDRAYAYRQYLDVLAEDSSEQRPGGGGSDQVLRTGNERFGEALRRLSDSSDEG